MKPLNFIGKIIGWAIDTIGLSILTISSLTLALSLAFGAPKAESWYYIFFATTALIVVGVGFVGVFYLTYISWKITIENRKKG